MTNVLVKKDKNPETDAKQAHFSDKQKYNACVIYKITGSLAETCRQTGVGYETLRLWRTTDWWKELEREISHEAKTQLGGKLKKLVDKAVGVLEDKLENGDIWVNQKTGEVTRVPLNAKTTNQILKDQLDKSVVLERLAREEKIHENTERIQDRLLKLAHDFERFSKSKVIEAEVVQDAVHDERETGLQEGEGLGTPAPDAS